MNIYRRKYEFNISNGMDSEKFFDGLCKCLEQIDDDKSEDIYVLEMSYNSDYTVTSIAADKETIDRCIQEYIIDILPDNEVAAVSVTDGSDKSSSDDEEVRKTEDDEKEDEEDEEEDSDDENTEIEVVFPLIPLVLIYPDGISEEDERKARILFETMTKKIDDIDVSDDGEIEGSIEDIRMLYNMLIGMKCRLDPRSSDFMEYFFSLFD